MGSEKFLFRAGLLVLLLAFAGCAAVKTKPHTDQGSVDPGSGVIFKGDRISPAYAGSHGLLAVEECGCPP